jgi:hypothetical protein
MPLKKRETPGSMLFGLSDNAYLFLCRFDTIRLHSFRGRESRSALTPLRTPLACIFRRAFPPCQFHANRRANGCLSGILKFPTFHSKAVPVHSLHQSCKTNSTISFTALSFPSLKAYGCALAFHRLPTRRPRGYTRKGKRSKHQPLF